MAPNDISDRYAAEYTAYHPRDVSLTHSAGKLWNSISSNRAQWGRANGVHAAMFPFAYVGDNNPFDAILATANYIESREPYQERITSSRLRTITETHTNSVPHEVFRDALLMRGWWEGGKVNASGRYYYNPEYAHLSEDHEITADRPRDRHIHLYIAAAYYRPPSLLAPAFGFAENDDPADSVTQYARHDGIEWVDERDIGRHAMGRTVKTLRAWGYSAPTIAHAFNLSCTTTYRLSDLVADFHPPEDPSYLRSDDPDAPEYLTCAGEGCSMALVKTARGPRAVELPALDADGNAYCFRCSTPDEDHLAKQPSYCPPYTTQIPGLPERSSPPAEEVTAD